jgi:D-alanyl-D-alanine carboxypeptidase
MMKHTGQPSSAKLAGSIVRSKTGLHFSLSCRSLLITLMAIIVQVTGVTQASANPLYAGLVIDAKTGKVLYSRHADAKRHPASLTKMMTLYLVFEDLKAGKITRATRVPMTKEGASRPPSKIGLKVGQTMSVNQAILALVTKSANDVASAVGGKLSGSEAAFARRMTRKARELGMTNTTFKNASGLTAKRQLTTARDMATLGLALREHFPSEYKVFQTRVFKYGKRRYGNHNKLLGRVRGVDGIKTGYTRAAGFNLVSSASHNGRSIVAVVMGGRSGKRRNAWMKTLIGRYLPKASRGKKQRLVALPTGARDTDLTRLARIPIPTFAPRAQTMAYAATANVRSATSLVAVPVRRVRTTTMISPARFDTARTVEGLVPPTPVPRPTNASIQTPKDPPRAAVVSSADVGGWHIQLAAGTNRDELKDLLHRVQSRNPRLLSDAQIHMPQASGGAHPVYRARFAGFENKTTARQACKALKRQRVDCLAIAG